MLTSMTSTILLALRVAIASPDAHALTPEDCAFLQGTYVYPEHAPPQCVLPGEDIGEADDV
jgi:hypothetical protein